MGRGARGRRRGRKKSKAARSKRSSASSSSSSKSSKSKSKRRSTAASKRRKVRSVAKAARAAKRAAKASTSTSTSKNKTKKKRRTPNLRKTLKQKIKSLGLNKKKTETKKKTISASQSRKQVRQKTKDKIATRKKISLRSITKALGNLTKGAAAYASGVNTKPKSKLQRQWASFQDRVKQLSTPEAKRERRMKRLYNQHGLDYSRMKDGLTIRANVGMALNREHKIPGTNIKIRVPKNWVKRIPQSIKNIKFNHTLRSPTKLGPRDGWYRGKYNSTGSTTGIENIGSIIERPRIPFRDQDQMGPEDWLGDFYKRYNIGGRGGNLDQEARDYWSKEAETKGRTAVLDIIRGTARNQGTWGGMSEADEARIAKIPKGSRTNYKGTVIDRRSARFRSPKRGRPTGGSRNPIKTIMSSGLSVSGGASAAKAAKRKSNLQLKGAKRRMAKSLAAHMAARRGI